MAELIEALESETTLAEVALSVEHMNWEYGQDLVEESEYLYSPWDLLPNNIGFLCDMINK